MHRDGDDVGIVLPDDLTLLKEVKAGNRQAFAHLFERHFKGAQRVAWRYLRSEADVDDVVAESFSRLLAVLDSGQGPETSFKSYLYTVIRHLSFDRLQQTNKQLSVGDISEWEVQLPPTAGADETIFASLEGDLVKRALTDLPLRWQKVLWLTQVEKRAPREIAADFGLTPNGVAALAYRAREALREAYLSQHLPEAVASSACDKAQDSLGALVRSTLPKRDVRLVLTHIQRCSDCNRKLIEVEDLNAEIRRRP